MVLVQKVWKQELGHTLRPQRPSRKERKIESWHLYSEWEKGRGKIRRWPLSGFRNLHNKIFEYGKVSIDRNF